MYVSRIWTSLILVFAAICSAQTPPTSTEPSRPAEFMHSRGPLQPPLDLGGVLQAMKAELTLDASVLGQAEQIITDHRAATMILRRQMATPPELSKTLEEAREELKKAQAENDDQRLKTVMAEMQVVRRQIDERTKPIREQLVKLQEETHGKLQTIMPVDQKSKFEEIWTEQTGPDRGRLQLRRDPRYLRKVIERLKDVSPDQKKQIDDLFKQHEEAQRTAKDPLQVARVSQNQRLMDSMMAILTAPQREQVKAILNVSGPVRPTRDGATSAPAGH